MKEIKHIIFIASCCTLLLCTLLSATKTEYKNKPIPTVEDTILQQLGGKLYFRFGDKAPVDSISVLEAHHWYIEEFGRDSYYKFIVHSKNTSFHKPFTNLELEKTYKSYFEVNEDLPDYYGENFRTFYNQQIEKQKKDIDTINIDPKIRNYNGYWIYLSKYKGQFYIDDHWAWLSSFHISDSILTTHYMDGPAPLVIQSFIIKGNGDFYLNDELYELVDKNLYIYKHAKMYVVPSWNVHKFEIIEYANNSGNLIASGYCDID